MCVFVYPAGPADDRGRWRSSDYMGAATAGPDTPAAHTQLHTGIYIHTHTYTQPQLHTHILSECVFA